MLLFSTCKKEKQEIKKELFTGYAQKGPFINGSSVLITDLDSMFNQTGKSYSLTIANNSGKFEQKEMILSSSYVQIKVDGYYYNEVRGEKSESPLTLYALANIKEANSVNVNILTHLERSRIEYLVKNEGMNFTDAKIKAQKEVLTIFGFEDVNIGNSENLDITQNNEGNAILLAMSVILQGYRTTAELSELLANISTDISQTGTIQAMYGSELIDDARFLNFDYGTALPNTFLSNQFPPIKQTLEKRCMELNIPATIPDFKKYVKQFISNSKFKPFKNIAIDNTPNNLLSDSCKSISLSSNNLCYAVLPKGTCLSVEITRNGQSCFNHPLYPLNAFENISAYDEQKYFQVTVVIPNNTANLQDPVNTADVKVAIYENIESILTKIPTKVRYIPVN